MKNVILIFALALIGTVVNAQNFQKVEETKEVTWFGLDFTQAVMVGSPNVDFTDPEAIVTRYYEWWNLLFLNEAKKYNIAKTFNKKVLNKISTAVDLNSKVDPSTLVSYDHNKFSDQDLKDIVSSYKGDGTGMGLLFAVENFEKANDLARFYVVFFDIETGEILVAQPGAGKIMAGFGFRNRWANAFYNALRDIKKEYPEWGKEDIK